VLVHVGRLTPNKGQATLLRIFNILCAKFTNAQLVYVGEGPDRPWLTNEANRLGLGDRVHFLGPRDDVPAILAHTDLFVFPSTTEGFGLAPLEAMAASLPVVAYDLSALRGFVAHQGSGLLVPEGCPQQLASATRDLLRDPARCRAMGRAGRAIVEQHFSMERTARWRGQIYRRATGPRPASMPTADDWPRPRSARLMPSLDHRPSLTHAEKSLSETV
jgi:glycosyltransferase involved in cell wall biosynthesis